MFSIRRTLIILLISFVSLSFAQQPGSVMSTGQQPLYSSSPGISKSSKQSEHCSELRQKADELKGKPQRRYAASERYKAECTNQDRR